MVKNMNESTTKPKDNNSRLVLPGELVQQGIDFLAGQGTYRDNKDIRSKYLGILKKQEHSVRVIPLSGKYMPEVGDFVLGEVEYVSFSSWRLNINSPYNATLPLSAVNEFIERGADLSNYYKRGDLLLVKIESLSKDMDVTVNMKDRNSRKLYGGRIITITPAKVPRVIGKRGTMVSIINNKTNCLITVGQNGLIWTKGKHEDLVAEAIQMIEKHSHESGLTDRVSAFLDERLKSMGNNKGPSITEDKKTTSSKDKKEVKKVDTKKAASTKKNGDK